MLHTLGSMALAGLAYSSGSTLWGGWVTNRRQMNIQHDSQAFQGQLEAKRQAFQGRLEENRQAFQAELAERQQAFQAALAERNFQQSAQLQREITAMKAALDRDLQEQRFAHDREMWSMNQFVNNEWPLIKTPDGYVDYLKQLGCPMSVIVTGKLEDPAPTSSPPPPASSTRTTPTSSTSTTTIGMEGEYAQSSGKRPARRNPSGTERSSDSGRDAGH